VSTWQTYAAICFVRAGVIFGPGVIALGAAGRGPAGITLMDPLVSTLWGVLVFDEPDPGRHLLPGRGARRDCDVGQRAGSGPFALLESNEDAPRVASPRPEDPAACPHPA